MNIHIKKNDTWPNSTWKRLVYNNFVGFTFRSSQEWVCSTDFYGRKSFSIKLIGFSEVRPFSWKRIKYAGWSQFLSFTHEDSDRIVCKYDGENKVGIFTYSYRRGLGPSTNMKKAREADFEVSKKLGVVKNGESFKVGIDVKDKKTVYKFYKFSLQEDDWEKINEVDVKRKSKSLSRFWSYSHASGYHGDTALNQVDIKISRV